MLNHINLLQVYLYFMNVSLVSKLSKREVVIIRKTAYYYYINGLMCSFFSLFFECLNIDN